MVEKGGSIVDDQLRGDWRLLKVLVDLIERRGDHCWYGLDLCSWEEVPEDAHCRPIPISCIRAPEKDAQTSFFLPSSLAPLFGVAGQRLPIWTCLQLNIMATHSRRHKLTVRVA